ncbi:hypothetical protein ABL78_3836 [Leptomonas seymouri]|uniref:PH-like domain-containing protein n=1 Tax=Leptomonas seymouri TaxID=5684 RepID=A0A0N1HZ09_LEPSE|nr:hypothetical protein ABL78_3836 [Leptomonas seymouri]|eukprot:KPI87074.1 hypothetical protein ABL78_3836 [Leptomonas seymouri]
MWYNSGNIADSLSREFRAMSSERERRWSSERGRAYGLPDTTHFYNGGSRAKSPILRYGSQRRQEHKAYEGYQPIRCFSHSDNFFSRGGGSDHVLDHAPQTGSRSDKAQPRHYAAALGPYERPPGASVRAPAPYNNRGRNRDAYKYHSGNGDKCEDGEASYLYSYSNSTGSETERGSSSTSSEYSDEAYKPRGRARSGGPLPRARSDSVQTPRRVRYTPTGPTGAVRAVNSEAVVHWVGDGRGDTNHNAQRPVDTARGGTQQLPGAHDSRACVASLVEPQRSAITSPMPALQPSGLLCRVIEAVAYYRGVQMPSTIPSEVTLAFDEYVSRGSAMLKFLPHGPPHSRFFIIRFFEVVPRRRQASKAGSPHASAVPYAVLGWYKKATSRHMIRFLPLHDLIEVKTDGADHPYVQRRTVQPGVLRGPRTGLSTNYVYADFILQFRFRSRLSCGEETLALRTANRTQHLAWLVVGSFISQVGGGGASQLRCQKQE